MVVGSEGTHIHIEISTENNIVNYANELDILLLESTQPVIV